MNVTYSGNAVMNTPSQSTACGNQLLLRPMADAVEPLANI